MPVPVAHNLWAHDPTKETGHRRRGPCSEDTPASGFRHRGCTRGQVRMAVCREHSRCNVQGLMGPEGQVRSPGHRCSGPASRQGRVLESCHNGYHIVPDISGRRLRMLFSLGNTRKSANQGPTRGTRLEWVPSFIPVSQRKEPPLNRAAFPRSPRGTFPCCPSLGHSYFLGLEATAGLPSVTGNAERAGLLLRAAALFSSQCPWPAPPGLATLPDADETEALSVPRAHPWPPVEVRGEGGATFESR